jgi:PAS domain S-box-containing protein
VAKALIKPNDSSLLKECNFTCVSEFISNELDSRHPLSSQSLLNEFCRQQFSLLDNQLPIYLLVNSRAEIIYLNSTGCDLLGVTQREVFASCWLTRFILPEQRTELLLVFEQILLGYGRAYQDYYYEVQSTHSMILPYQWDNTQLVNSRGEIVAIFFVGRDIRTP